MLAALLLAPLLAGAPCRWHGRPLEGRIQLVTSQPDVRVELVTALPDMRVRQVRAAPRACEWQIVHDHPDVRVELVHALPDVRVQLDPE